MQSERRRSSQSCPKSVLEKSQMIATSLKTICEEPPIGEGTVPEVESIESNLLKRLMLTRNFGNPSDVEMTEAELRKIAIGAREQFLKEPAFLDLDAPVKICGDTHGQYGDLLRIFDYAGKPDNHNYLFLGDYVDRGKQSLETVVLLFCYKLKYPNNFFLLRGNHESAAINRIYGFYDECKRRFSVKLWKSFQDSFNCMPIAALVGGKIFCMHGGLSPHLSSWDQIRRVQRPTDVPDNGIICDLLWSDPDMKVTGYKASRRGISYLFGDDVVHEFCAKMNIDLVVRAHQVVEDGYEFFANRKLVTIFSAPNYCGMFQNAAVVINVAKNLECEFQILKPQDTKAVVEQKIKS